MMKLVGDQMTRLFNHYTDLFKAGFLLDPGHRDLYSAISILVPAILSGGAYRYL